MSQKNKIKDNKLIKIAITSGLAVIVIITIVLFTFARGNKKEISTIQADANKVKTSDTSDLVIPLSGITEKASFYDYTVDGTKLEVIAIKAADGSIRTAFNTCQVCYSSGKGYYVQQGDYLVCQNCGNRFKASDVEVSKGGCNPVPIFNENKTVDTSNITISNSFLQKSKKIFENWKN